MTSIDAVISWVDGYDLVYQQKLKSFCLQQGIEINQAVEPTRIQQCNEIHYCLQSLQRFVPWLRKIYIITNQQIPPTVAHLQGTAFGNKIEIIDQNDLRRQFNLSSPLFNSLSIEWLMWRIPGLSNQFIYLNDDFFIFRKVTPEDFFNDNKIVLRGQWKVQTKQKLSYQVKQHLIKLGIPGVKQKKDPHRSWQEKSAQLAGWTKHFYLLPHAPFPLIKKTFDDTVLHMPSLFSDNANYPFRHEDQISSIPLMTHINIKNKDVVYDSKLKTIMVNGACHSLTKIKSRLNHAQNNSNVAFICMQSIDQASPSIKQYLLDWLKQYIE